MRGVPAARAECAPGMVVGIWRRLPRTLRLRYVAQVDADARPCAGPAAHRVNEDVVFLQQRRGLGMPSLPAFEAGKGVFFVLRVRDGDERLRRLAPADALRFCGRAFPSGAPNAGRLVALLLVVRWPRRVSQTRGFLRGGELQQ